MTTFPDLLLLVIILGVSAYGACLIGKMLGLRTRLSVGLFLWHTLFCIAYWFFVEIRGGDSNNYFKIALLGQYDWRPGTRFVESFTALFASVLEFDKLNTFLVYNMFGVAGLLLLASLVISNWPACLGLRKYIPYLILIMPGLSFWSSAIGKDAPAFFASCLASYAFLDVRRRQILFAVAILVMFVVRPHVAGFMILAAGITMVTGRQINMINRIVIIIFLSAASIAALPFIVSYVGLEGELSPQGVEEYIETRQDYNLGSGGSVDISSMSLPLKIGTYLFRPLLIDASGLLGMAASVENLFLLALFLAFFIRGFLLLSSENNVSVRYNLIFFVISVLVFSMTTSNLGIAVRQKTMILPAIFFLIALSSSKLYEKRHNKQNVTTLS